MDMAPSRRPEGDYALLARRQLQVEDLSQTCRRDRFCIRCFHAFCSHCCRWHHSNWPFHSVIPVDVDAAGRPTFSRHYPKRGSQMSDFTAGLISAEDYATQHRRDAFCIFCKVAFCASACPHHHHECGPDAVLRIEERGGRHCVRCTGSEWWFPYMESILDDPVGEDEDEHGRYQMLLPVLRGTPGSCVRCGGQVPHPLSSHCSARCAKDHHREVAQRRERREARRAARELANLQIDQ